MHCRCERKYSADSRRRGSVYQEAAAAFCTKFCQGLTPALELIDDSPFVAEALTLGKAPAAASRVTIQRFRRAAYRRLTPLRAVRADARLHVCG